MLRPTVTTNPKVTVGRHPRIRSACACSRDWRDSSECSGPTVAVGRLATKHKNTMKNQRTRYRDDYYYDDVRPACGRRCEKREVFRMNKTR